MISTSAAEFNKCPHCGNHHSARCPQVRAIEYYPDGRVKRVEFVDGGSNPLPVSVPLVQPPFAPFDPPYTITVSTPPDSPFVWVKPDATISTVRWSVYNGSISQ